MGDRIIRTRAEWIAGYWRVLEARRTDTPADQLVALALDEIRPVRLYIARNPATPPEALARLAVDTDDWVQWNALLNAHTPETALRAVAEQEAIHGGQWQLKRHVIARHPMASPDLCTELLANGACTCRDECIYARTFA